MQDICIPSRFREKWSMVRICPENSTAHSSTAPSPGDMAKPSVMHRKYSPATAMDTLPHSSADGLLPQKRPKRGTITIYMAVMKPAFPADVPAMPNCCILEARVSITPQAPAPRSKARFSPAVRWKIDFRPGTIRAAAPSTASSATKATSPRRAVKVKGPTWSAPALWAEKPVPQITAASSGRTVWRRFRFIRLSISSPFRKPQLSGDSWQRLSGGRPAGRMGW